MNGGGGGPRAIPARRVIERLDGLMARRDYAGAERLLLYWLEEARQGGDARGELTMRNELTGHYRKVGDRDAALANAGAALALVDRLGLGGTVTEGTTCVNAATALCAFGEAARALPLFERARAAYEGGAGADDRLLGGLYNNMALACAALARWDEAEALYGRAMARMGRVENGALEQAVTCLNLAEMIERRDGPVAGEARIFELAARAVALLDDAKLARDGYYAFVCEKCAPALDHYGWFADAERLRAEAERIYGRA